jgi:hypothetical protein
MKFKDTKYGDLTGQTYNGDIDVSSMGLTSLEGAPEIVKGNFWCLCNRLNSLNGAPKEIINGKFSCSFNRLTSLEGAPSIVVGGVFDCSFNQLISLKGTLKIVKKSFNCSNNKLQTLDYLPEGITPETLTSDFSEEEVLEFFRKNRPEILI